MDLKFDTRDKKPKLYGLAAISAAVVVLIVLLTVSDPQKHELAVSLTLAVYFLIVVVMLVSAFFRQIQYNPYSYNTIYYMGFALFALSISITYIIISVNIIKAPGMYGPLQFLSTLLNSAKNYMLLSAPFILIFSVALCVSNISLIRHEGRRLVNILGIILALLLVAGELFLFKFDYYVSGSLSQVRAHELIGNLFAAGYLYFECMLIGAIVANAIAARHEPRPDKDYIIILGCGIRKDGSPTPLLRGRIDKALAFYEKQKAATGREPYFVTSGGQGPNEVISESLSMKRYLMERGIPEDRIIEEDRSTDTFENMKFSKEKILQHGQPGKIAFSTTGYHVFRSGLYARRVKMRAVGMGSRTRWYFWPNASVREFVGILTEHRGKQAAILSGLIAIYIVLTFIVYR